MTTTIGSGGASRAQRHVRRAARAHPDASCAAADRQAACRPAAIAAAARSMAGGSQSANSGVTGSVSHSPSRKSRRHHPLPGEVQSTGVGRAVIGRACRSHSWSWPVMAHSASCGAPDTAATRRASSAGRPAGRGPAAAAGRRVRGFDPEGGQFAGTAGRYVPARRPGGPSIRRPVVSACTPSRWATRAPSRASVGWCASALRRRSPQTTASRRRPPRRWQGPPGAGGRSHDTRTRARTHHGVAAALLAGGGARRAG